LTVFEVEISLKRGIVDPEGENTRKALKLLGFTDVKHVSSSKLFRIEIEGDGPDAELEIEEMCTRLLANPAIHLYRYRRKE